MENVFVDAAACGDLNGVKELLANSATTAAQVNMLDKDGRSAFHYACLNDDVALLKVLVADERVDINLRSPKGDTCMHLAALYACLEVLKILFADPRTSQLINAKNQWGETPLHLCAGSGDKGAARAAALLLEANASLLEVDKWHRGPVDVAHDNGENSLVEVFKTHLAKQSPELQANVKKVTEEYLKVKNDKPVISEDKKQEQAKMIFSGLGSALKGLKKTEITEKTMFAKSEGKVSSGIQLDAKSTGKVLSKMIDFPGDKEEIKSHLANKEVNPGGRDAYGLTALHKFASWNKVEFIDLLLPHLTKEQINEQDPDGKTALHWACEMASVAAVSRLMECPDIDSTIKDAKGRTPMDILDSGTGSVIQRLKNALLKN